MSAAPETTRGILLRRTKLSETSLIITWLTESHGLLKTVAKGARGPKSSFRGQLDLLFEAELTYLRSARSELHQLREVVLLDTHEPIRLAFRRLELACYFVELLELTSEPDHPVPEALDLMRRALAHLDANDATRKAMLHFEKELATGLGILEEGRDASAAIFRQTHHLPKGRKDLLAALA